MSMAKSEGDRLQALSQAYVGVDAEGKDVALLYILRDHTTPGHLTKILNTVRAQGIRTVVRVPAAIGLAEALSMGLKWH